MQHIYAVMQLLITIFMAPNFFCCSLFLLQNKRRHLQGSEGTVRFTLAKLVNKATNVSALADSCWIAGVSWDEDMAAVGDETKTSTQHYFIYLLY